MRDFVPNPDLPGYELERRFFSHELDEARMKRIIPVVIPAGHETFAEWKYEGDRTRLVLGLRRKSNEPTPPNDGLDALADAKLKTIAGKEGVSYDPKNFARGDVIVRLRKKRVEDAR